MSISIVDLYRQDRADAVTADEKEEVWRTYAIAVLEEFAERGRTRDLAGPSIRWRRRKDDKDSQLGVRCVPYWRAISDDDLRALWRALEAARYTPKDDDAAE